MRKKYVSKASRIFAVLLMSAGFVTGAVGTASAGDMELGTTIAWAGVEARENNLSPYVGVEYFFTGDNFSDGFFVRADGYYSDYDYNSAAVVGGHVDADAYAFDAMVGYQKALDGVIVNGLVGPEYVDHDLSPTNTLDKNNGADWGVKVRAEAETDYSSEYYGDLIASYGTAKEHYYVRGRAGYDFTGDIVGPEASVEGNGQYNEHRIGAFISSYDFDPVYLSGSAGYSKMESRSGGGSPYITLEISTRF